MSKVSQERYFVDERSGCIAVRDRNYTDPDDNCLQHYTEGVVRYWYGEHVLGEKCITCGHRASSTMVVPKETVALAKELASELNAKEIDETQNPWSVDGNLKVIAAINMARSEEEDRKRCTRIYPHSGMKRCTSDKLPESNYCQGHQWLEKGENDG